MHMDICYVFYLFFTTVKLGSIFQASSLYLFLSLSVYLPVLFLISLNYWLISADPW